MTASQQQPDSSFTRYLLPSVRDLIFLISFWALLAGPLSTRPLADADIGWHIRSGEQILATRSVPRTDPFSSTMQGQPWFAWEWLYDAVLGLANRAMGLNGVVWLAALLMSTTFAILFRELLIRGMGLPVALPLWLLAIGAASIHMFARPHIVSWLFTLVWFVMLERWEQGSAGRGMRWFFPASMVLWVNLHGGWVLGLTLLAIYGISATVESLRGSDVIAQIHAAWRARAMGWAFAASCVATLINPYGWGLHLHIYRYLRDPYLMNHIAEFRSPDFHGWGQRCFVMILVLTLLGAGRLRAKNRVSQWLVLLLVSSGGVYAARNLPISAMLLVLIAGPGLWASCAELALRSGVWRPLQRGASKMVELAAWAGSQEFHLRGHLWPIAGALAALAVCLSGGRMGSQVVINAHFDAKHLPAGAVDYLERDGGPESIFGPDQWGGYFIYRLYPRRQVVVDDRHDLYGSARFREYLTIIQVEPGWPELLRKWRVRTMVLPTESTLASLVRKTQPEWQTVYEDPVAVVLEKKP